MKLKGARLWMLLCSGVLVGVGLWQLLTWMNAPPPAVKPEPPVPVETMAVGYREMDVVLSNAGTLIPWARVLVIPKVKGQRIERILVQRGDRVRRGQLIAQLDETTARAKVAQLEARLAEAQAAVVSAEARVGVLEKDLKRYQRLVKMKAAPEQKLEHIRAQHREAVAALRLARARVAAAEAALKRARIWLGDHRIVAPIKGVISRKMVDAGSLSSDKKPIVEITQINPLKLLTWVSERNYRLVRPGQEGRLRVDGLPGRVFKVVVHVLAPTLNPRTRAAEVELKVPNPTGELRPGMYGRVKIVLARRKVLAVPLRALRRMPGTGAWFVFVVSRGKAWQRNVVLGESFGPWREVREGLKPGEQVIVKGAGWVKHGARVKVVREEG